MKVHELLESQMTATDLIDEFNKDDNIRFCLLSDLGMTKIPMKIRSNENASYLFQGNLLSSFDNFPEQASSIYLGKNKFTSLKDIHKHIKQITCREAIKTGLFAANNVIKSHVLGLLKIDGLTEVMLYGVGDPRELLYVENIINKYLPNKRGNDAVMECQNALIDAGYEEYAQL